MQIYQSKKIGAAMSNIALVTTSRADWGLLVPVLDRLLHSPKHKAKLIVTGQHLDQSLEIFSNYQIDELIECSCERRNEEAAACGISASILANFGQYLSVNEIDLVLVLGDRFEMLSVAVAAVINRVPIAHIFGGDTTLGAIDDSVRHAISKLASLHFPSNTDSAAKLVEMGELPDRIIVSGSTGIDTLSQVKLISRDVFFDSVGLIGTDSVLLVAYHPETLADGQQKGIEELLSALEKFPDLGLLFTGTNIDPGHGDIERVVATYVASHANAVFVDSLGSRLFAAALNHCVAIIGNSSAGILEAPYFGTPTINIGNRQAGRRRSASVMDVGADAAMIEHAIRSCLQSKNRVRDYFFGEGNASAIIASSLESFGNFDGLIIK